jgi:uncharacterized membrane protein YesL
MIKPKINFETIGFIAATTCNIILSVLLMLGISFQYPLGNIGTLIMMSAICFIVFVALEVVIYIVCFAMKIKEDT